MSSNNVNNVFFLIDKKTVEVSYIILIDKTFCVKEFKDPYYSIYPIIYFNSIVSTLL